MAVGLTTGLHNVPFPFYDRCHGWHADVKIIWLSWFQICIYVVCRSIVHLCIWYRIQLTVQRYVICQRRISTIQESKTFICEILHTLPLLFSWKMQNNAEMRYYIFSMNTSCAMLYIITNLINLVWIQKLVVFESYTCFPDRNI